MPDQNGAPTTKSVSAKKPHPFQDLGGTVPRMVALPEGIHQVELDQVFLNWFKSAKVWQD